MPSDRDAIYDDDCHQQQLVPVSQSIFMTVEVKMCVKTLTKYFTVEFIGFPLNCVKVKSFFFFHFSVNPVKILLVRVCCLAGGSNLLLYCSVDGSHDTVRLICLCFLSF